MAFFSQSPRIFAGSRLSYHPVQRKSRSGAQGNAKQAKRGVSAHSCRILCEPKNAAAAPAFPVENGRKPSMEGAAVHLFPIPSDSVGFLWAGKGHRLNGFSDTRRRRRFHRAIGFFDRQEIHEDGGALRLFAANSERFNRVCFVELIPKSRPFLSGFRNPEASASSIGRYGQPPFFAVRAFPPNSNRPLSSKGVGVWGRSRFALPLLCPKRAVFRRLAGRCRCPAGC